MNKNRLILYVKRIVLNKFVLSLGLGLFFIASGIYLYPIGSEYLYKKQKNKELKEIISYLENKKEDVLKLQNNLLSNYTPVEENIKKALKEIGKNNVSFKEISKDKNVKTIGFTIQNIDNQKLAKLVFNIENASPTIVIESMEIELIANRENNLKASFQVSSIY